MFPRLLCVIIKCLVTEVPVYVTCGEQKNAGQSAKPGEAIALTERGDFISFSSFVRTYMYLLPHISCHQCGCGRDAEGVSKIIIFY